MPTHTFAIEAAAVDAVTVGEIVDPDGNSLTVVQPHSRT
ncbi:hypothetical protein QE392_002215 [Microbacterium proteolyticum]|nr:hypothetical protein [Microbacterium sp. SORGH_AS_0344]MDQ1170411.1 hypothetical protein [Microbacterium proteolyticum]